MAVIDWGKVREWINTSEGKSILREALKKANAESRT